ncbi:hypothetical protein ACLOJK_016213 [Asimina triloba]
MTQMKEEHTKEICRLKEGDWKKDMQMTYMKRRLDIHTILILLSIFNLGVTFSILFEFSVTTFYNSSINSSHVFSAAVSVLLPGANISLRGRVSGGSSNDSNELFAAAGLASRSETQPEIQTRSKCSS